jgi:AcrR family transcriptional regulator
MSTETKEHKTKKAQQSEKTRSALLKAARKIFGLNGYSRTSLEEVAKRASVTIGAVYHQYGDKRTLFEAVLEQLQREVFEGARERSREKLPRQSLERFAMAAELILDSFTDANYCQIVMIDGPAVLGWSTWHRICEDHLMCHLRSVLEQQMDLGRIQREPSGPLAHILLGALTETGLVIAHAEDKQAARKEMGAALVRLGSRMRTEK